jgi:hypothetical protein
MDTIRSWQLLAISSIICSPWREEKDITGPGVMTLPINGYGKASFKLYIVHDQELIFLQKNGVAFRVQAAYLPKWQFGE